MLIACEYKKDVLTHKADTALERLDSITKEKNAQRQYDSALYYGHEEFKLAQKKSNIKFSEKALSRIITAHKNNKNYDSVIFYADKLYTFAEQYKDTFYMARARFRKAQSYKAKELYSDAYEAYLDSKELYVAINDSVKVAGKFLELSSLEKKFGDLLASQLLAIEGLDYLQKRKYPITESKLYFNIAVAAKEQGDFITAEKRINQTLDLANRPEAVQKIGLANVINYYNTKANIFKEQKFYEDAIEIYENLLNSNLGKLPVREEARINSNLAHTLFLKDGFSRRSDSLLQYALTVYQKSAYTQGLISINMNLAELYAENNKQKAIYHVNKAIEYATEANIITSLQEALRNKVLIANNVEDMIAYIRLTEEIERKEDKMQSRFANARLDVKMQKMIG